MSIKHISSDRLRQIISLFFAFMIMWSVTLAVLSVGIYHISSSKFTATAVQKASYVTLISDEIKEEYEALGIPGGLPEHYFDDKVDMDTLAADISNYIQSCYTGTPFKASAVKDTLYNGFVEYARGKMPVTDEVKNQLQYLAQVCEQQYLTKVKSMLFPYWFGYAAKLHATSLKMLAVLSVFAVFAIGFCFYLLRKRIREMMRYLCYSFVGSAMVMGGIPLFFRIVGWPQKLGFGDASMQALMREYFAFCVRFCLIGAAVALTIAVFSQILTFCIKKQAKISK